MFKEGLTVEYLNSFCKDTMIDHIGIEFIEVGDDFLVARMPVNSKTSQPEGLLHGGASVSLAETLGSAATLFTLDQDRQFCVGLEINANHVKAMRDGYVYGKTTPIHIGEKTQVWEIRITNEKNQLVSICRITMAILDKK